MSADVYGSRRGRSKVPLPRRDANQVSMPSPLHEGKTITWKRKSIPSSEIWNVCVKSKHNPRNEKYLNRQTLSDLLDKLETTKTNSDLARAFEDSDGKLHILSGLRRSTALSFIEDGMLQIEYSADLSEEEQSHFALINEGQRGLSNDELVDLLVNEEEKLGRSMSTDEAAEFLSVSRSKVSIIRKYIAVPKEVYDVIGHPDHLSKGAVGYIKAKIDKDGKESVLGALKSCDVKQVSEPEFAKDPDSYKRYITKLMHSIMVPAKPVRKSRAPELSTVWENVPRSVIVKRTTRGELSLKIAESGLNEELESQLVEVLTKHIGS